MIEQIVMVAGVLVVVSLIIIIVAWWRRRMRPIKVEPFKQKWAELQKLCRSKTTWAEAVINADNLLGEALKKKHIRGHNMGERMVKAQRLFTDNDGVWFAHKLRNKIDADPTIKLKESEVKQALVGFRQALKDLGALPNAA
jgi:hypothetical protein